jgi:hypothetical protein
MISEAIIQQAVGKIRDYGANYIYFFQSLQSPDWVAPLWDQGFFKNPPPPIRQGAGISYPLWVETQYLVRIAAKTPELVAAVVSAMAETENVRVHRDVLEIANKLPPHLSNSLLSKVIGIIGKTHGDFVYEQLAQLIAHLAQGNEIKGASELSRHVLEFFPDSEQEEKRVRRIEQSSIFADRLEPAPHWETYQYKDLIDHGIRVLMNYDPLAVLKIGTEALDKAINLSIWDDEVDERDGNDGSVVWRPAIEEDDQNHDFHHRELLVPLIRDAGERLLEQRPDDFAQIESVMDGCAWDIFKRIHIHLCRVRPTAAGPQRIARLLTQRELFDNYRFQHEWSLLLSAEFKNLHEQSQAIILTWIENEFDADWRIKRHQEETGQVPSDDLVQGWKKRWQRDKLHFIAADLPDKWQRYYNNLVLEVGSPEHPDFPIWSSDIRTGSTSPKDSTELLAMPTNQVIEYLKHWQPSGNPFDDSIEGLAAALESALKSEPLRFASSVAAFQEVRPDYVKAAIRGFKGAANEGKQIPWKETLQLCGWVLNQDQGPESAGGEPDEDQYWKWTRLEIVRFLREVLSGKEADAPFEFRNTVWRMLKILTEDPVPSREYEDKYSNGKRYATLSINTTRGEAMHALFDYADWVRRHCEASSRHNPAVEILKPLTDRLEPAKESTFTIRAVYAEHLGWLYHFHEEWLRGNLHRIFPKENSLRAYRSVAWQTFVTFCRPSLPLFHLLTSEYEFAIANLQEDKGSDTEHDLEHPDKALGHHLLGLYWSGHLSIDDPNSLISRFFENASDKVRGATIDFAGRAVKNTKQLDTQIAERLQHLFESRLKTVKTSRFPAQFERELCAFGTWVWAKKFDPKWTLHILEEILRLTKRRERFGHFVLEALAELSSTYPLETAKCFLLMISADQERLSWYLTPKEAKTILRNAAALPAAREIAVQAQDLLLRQGRFEFRALD